MAIKPLLTLASALPHLLPGTLVLSLNPGDSGQLDHHVLQNIFEYFEYPKYQINIKDFFP